MRRDGAFTLIELLVVVAVIAVLIAILLPSLGNARAQARAAKCGAGLHAVGSAVEGYLTENAAAYPPSYYYPTDTSGTLAPLSQLTNHPLGYAHWSGFLFGYTKDMKAFTCPEFEQGGLSRANPGPNGNNWIQGQTDQNGLTSAVPGALEDVQAPFMAFTANAAIISRNKYTPEVAAADGGNGQRLNVFVKAPEVRFPGRTILMTEFNTNWRTIVAPDPNGQMVLKSHRPVNPFIGAGGGTDEYSLSTRDYFSNTPVNALYDKNTWIAKVGAGAPLINDPQTQLNGVGRHHPGSFSYNGVNYGGTVNFLYADGHVERKNVAETVVSKEWGDAYYSLNGDNHVYP